MISLPLWVGLTGVSDTLAATSVGVVVTIGASVGEVAFCAARASAVCWANELSSPEDGSSVPLLSGTTASDELSLELPEEALNVSVDTSVLALGVSVVAA